MFLGWQLLTLLAAYVVLHGGYCWYIAAVAAEGLDAGGPQHIETTEGSRDACTDKGLPFALRHVHKPAAANPTSSSCSLAFPPGNCDGISASAPKVSTLQRPSSAALIHNALPVTLMTATVPPPTPGAEVQGPGVANPTSSGGAWFPPGVPMEANANDMLCWTPQHTSSTAAASNNASPVMAAEAFMRALNQCGAMVQGLAATNLTSSTVASFPPGVTQALKVDVRVGLTLHQVHGPASANSTNRSTPSTACGAEGTRAGVRSDSMSQQPSSAAFANGTLHASAVEALEPVVAKPIASSPASQAGSVKASDGPYGTAPLPTCSTATPSHEIHVGPTPASTSTPAQPGAEVKGSESCGAIPVRYVSTRFLIMVLLLSASASPFSDYTSQSVLMFIMIYGALFQPYLKEAAAALLEAQLAAALALGQLRHNELLSMTHASQVERQQLQAALGKVEEQLATSKAEGQRLQATLGKVEEQLATSEAEGQRLQASLGKVEEQLAASEAKGQRLQATLGKVEEQLVGALEEAPEKPVASGGQEQQLQLVGRQLDLDRGTMGNVLSPMAPPEDGVDPDASQRHGAHEQVQQLQERVTVLKAKLKGCVLHGRAFKQLVELLLPQLEGLQRDTAQLVRQVASLHAELAALEAEVVQVGVVLQGPELAPFQRFMGSGELSTQQVQPPAEDQHPRIPTNQERLDVWLRDDLQKGTYLPAINAEAADPAGRWTLLSGAVCEWELGWQWGSAATQPQVRWLEAALLPAPTPQAAEGPLHLTDQTLTPALPMDTAASSKPTASLSGGKAASCSSGTGSNSGSRQALGSLQRLGTPRQVLGNLQPHSTPGSGQRVTGSNAVESAGARGLKRVRPVLASPDAERRVLPPGGVGGLQRGSHRENTPPVAAGVLPALVENNGRMSLPC